MRVTGKRYVCEGLSRIRDEPLPSEAECSSRDQAKARLLPEPPGPHPLPHSAGECLCILRGHLR